MLFNIKNVHVELSSKCVLKCPRCPRTELDLDYLNQEISLDRFKSMFPSSALTQIETFMFCGHTGDPIYATEFLDIVEYIKHSSQCRINIVTNGSYKKSSWWQQLGQLLNKQDRVVFSVDGWDNASNNQYRVNSDFDSIVQGIKKLRSHSDCTIMWSMIYFSFNQDQEQHIKNLAQSLGCDLFKSVKSSKFDGKYRVNFVEDPLKPQSHLTASTLVYENEYEYFTSDAKEHDFLPVGVSKHPWAKCLNHLKEIFVNVQGYVYPCAWFGEDYLENDFIKNYKQSLCLGSRSIEQLLNDQQTWQPLLDSFESLPMPICQLKCNYAQQ
jgi:MoaA/NifB/PqqE/SkfB family radical SAM enzyme